MSRRFASNGHRRQSCQSAIAVFTPLLSGLIPSSGDEHAGSTLFCAGHSHRPSSVREVLAQWAPPLADTFSDMTASNKNLGAQATWLSRPEATAIFSSTFHHSPKQYGEQSHPAPLRRWRNDVGTIRFVSTKLRLVGKHSHPQQCAGTWRLCLRWSPSIDRSLDPEQVHPGGRHSNRAALGRRDAAEPRLCHCPVQHNGSLRF